jgi:phosphoglycerate dehydrogenase-like enzyme
MSKQIQDAYIVAATRLPVSKRNGMYRNVRPDDMLARADYVSIHCPRTAETFGMMNADAGTGRSISARSPKLMPSS